MKNLSSLAVVLLHSGVPEVTEDALRSFRQAYPVLSAPRVIVVENGPPPVSLDEFPGIERLTLAENSGYGRGNNAGIRAAFARGARNVVLMNNDVVLARGALEGIVQELERHPVSLVGVPLREPEGPACGGGRVSWWRLRAHLARVPVSGVELHYIHGACLGVTRQCVETIGLFREDFFLYWEDVEYGFRARAAGVRLSIADTTPLVHSRGSPKESEDPVKTYYLVRNAFLFAWEHAPLAARLWARALFPLRHAWAQRLGKSGVLRALDDAHRGVAGPLP